MSDPITTLLELNFTTLQLDEAQARIDIARAMFPADQMWQLELDRKQTEVDNKRAFVEALKFDIARRN